MRRTQRSEFADSRRAADEARRALLVKVKLRDPEPEPDPTQVEWGDPAVPTLNQINAAMADMRQAVEQLSAAYLHQPRRWVTGMEWPGAGWDQRVDAHRRSAGEVRAPYDPVIWPDEGYPCQVCWSVGRWPWEPARSCPASVDPVSTYCVEHGGQARPPKPESFKDETARRYWATEWMQAPVISGSDTRRIFSGVIA